MVISEKPTAKFFNRDALDTKVLSRNSSTSSKGHVSGGFADQQRKWT